MTTRFGRFEFPEGTQSPIETITDWDNRIGFPSGTHRHYLPIQGSWSGTFSMWGFARNRAGVYSIEPRTPDTKKAQLWTDVTAGKFDADIRTNAEDLLVAMGDSIARAWVGFHHEPENEEVGKGYEWGICGTRAQCKAAAEHFLRIVKDVMGDRCRIGQTLMAGSYASGRADEWLTDICEWVGIDGYNKGTTGDTFAKLMTPAHYYATQHGKKLVIQEMGVTEKNVGPNYKADWFNDARALLKTWPECRIVQYSNVVAKEVYLVDSSTTALNAFKAWAGDPYFRGSWT